MSPKFLNLLFLWVLIAGFVLLSPAYSQESSLPPFNQLVLAQIRTMPQGGGYSAGNTATHALHNAVSLRNGSLVVEATHATPSYCSGATYLVFLKALANLQSSGRLTLPPEILKTLPPSGQPDGNGIWGRWNANGPGTARLFTELGLGSNFADLHQARPGDFLKIWWGDSIGSTEHGHSVVFIGTSMQDGVPALTYWSSNVPGGFGLRTVPLSRIHRMLFSRLEHPERLIGAAQLPPTDHYLASLQTRISTPAEMNRLCGLHSPAISTPY